MKAVNSIVFLLILSTPCFSQNETELISGRALLYADSLINAFRYSNWPQYIEMSCPGVIKYYGGKKGYSDYIQRARKIGNPSPEELKEKTELIQLADDDISEWQCVIKKTRETIIDNKKAFIVSYLVGQSRDNGITWKYFDVAFNSVENIIYIMPDIFDTLAIPQRQVIFEKDQMASHH